MGTIGCVKTDCTVAATGTCLELHEVPGNCPFFKGDEKELQVFDLDPSSLPSSLDELIDEQQRSRTFHSGYELGAQDAAEIMRTNYSHFVGILGLYNAGKTCLISSLYSLASKGELLPKYMFAGSLTLQGFEDRLRLLRRWKRACLPHQLVEHTHLSDPRVPALMHMSLKEMSSQRRIDLLLTDLPGEWSKDLIVRAETAPRFDFLKRADGVIFVIDGPSLNAPTTRHLQIQNSKILLERLAEEVAVDKSIPLILLISKCDLLNMKQPDGLEQIYDHARHLGFRPRTVCSAAFSSQPQTIKNGAGILESIELVINPPCEEVKNKYRGERPQARSRSFYNFPVLPHD